VADAYFEDPRLARIYDPLDPDRSDLEVYSALVDEVGPRLVLDIGCGAGGFVCLLAQRGLDVVGLDPAAASLEVARTKPGADRVRWVHGDTTALPPLQVDIATMTGNVAQVFVTDDDWMMTMTAISQSLSPEGDSSLRAECRRSSVAQVEAKGIPQPSRHRGRRHRAR